MKSPIRALLATACLLLAPLLARADLVIVQSMNFGGSIQKTTIRIKGDKARTDMTIPEMSTIVDTTTGDLIVLNHGAKKFTKHAGAPPAGDSAPPVLHDTGKSEKVGNYTAEIYTAETPQAKITYWIAKGYPDAAAVNAEMKNVRTMEATRNHLPDLTHLDGMAVKSEITLNGGKTLIVTLVSTKIAPISDAVFQVPSGYTEADPNQ